MITPITIERLQRHVAESRENLINFLNVSFVEALANDKVVRADDLQKMFKISADDVHATILSFTNQLIGVDSGNPHLPPLVTYCQCTREYTLDSEMINAVITGPTEYRDLYLCVVDIMRQMLTRRDPLAGDVAKLLSLAVGSNNLEQYRIVLDVVRHGPTWKGYHHKEFIRWQKQAYHNQQQLNRVRTYDL